MKKAVWVLNVNNYRPDLCEWTLPTIRWWAKRIGAEYREINERVYDKVAAPVSITAEKLQIHNLGKGYDWNVLVDADVLIHPLAPDVTKGDPRIVLFTYSFEASRMFEMDDVLKSGDNVGIAGGFVVASKATHSLWTPPNGISEWQAAIKGTKRPFIIDEYIMSRNLAKFGMNWNGILPRPMVDELFVHLGNEEQNDEGKARGVDKARQLNEQWQREYDIKF